MTALIDTIGAHRLATAWRRAALGDEAERAAWRLVEGHGWMWDAHGLSAGGGAEWAAVAWERCGPAALAAMPALAIEATVGGEAALAGLSLGPFRDFLVPLRPADGPRRLRLEIDGAAGTWAFYADGALQLRSWCDAEVGSVADLFAGRLTLKAHRPAGVRFSDLSVSPLSRECRLSVVLTCHRFLQRLRVTLRNWCAQEGLAPGAYEVLGRAVGARSHPHLRVREVPVGPELASNKGAMINRAVAECRGAWVWLADADCLFGPDAVATALAHARVPALLYCERRHLSGAATDALLAGRSDGLRDFGSLAAAAGPRAPDCLPWGYTQIVPRSVIARRGYPERYNHFAHSDAAFARECERSGAAPARVPGLSCLHLDHPFAWYGTSVYL